MKWILALNIYF